MKGSYTLLNQKKWRAGREPDSESMHNQHDLSQPMAERLLSSLGGKSIGMFFCALLLTSIIANAILVYRQFFCPWELTNELPTRYAGLRRDVPTLLNAPNDFKSVNRTIQEAAWEAPDLLPESLFVALDEDDSIDLGLPHSQRWPWDLSKGVYIPIAAHELHCVKVLRTSINEYHDGIQEPQQTWQYEHLMHCLDVMRESVMCNVDDSLMYIGRLHGNVNLSHPRAGTGMTKMCRDWSKFTAWSHSHSACYRPVHWGEKGFDEIERYKYCPDGQRPWEDNDST